MSGRISRVSRVSANRKVKRTSLKRTSFRNRRVKRKSSRKRSLKNRRVMRKSSKRTLRRNTIRRPVIRNKFRGGSKVVTKGKWRRCGAKKWPSHHESDSQAANQEKICEKDEINVLILTFTTLSIKEGLNTSGAFMSHLTDDTNVLVVEGLRLLDTDYFKPFKFSPNLKIIITGHGCGGTGILASRDDITQDLETKLNEINDIKTASLKPNMSSAELRDIQAFVSVFKNKIINAKIFQYLLKNLNTILEIKDSNTINILLYVCNGTLLLDKIPNPTELGNITIYASEDEVERYEDSDDNDKITTFMNIKYNFYSFTFNANSDPFKERHPDKNVDFILNTMNN